jgi:predicted permease
MAHREAVMRALLRSFWWKILNLKNRTKSEAAFEDELEFHLQMEIEQNLKQGMSYEEARRRAMIALGGLEQTKEACRETRAIRWAIEFWRDLRYGWYLLCKSPGFSAIAVLTLALGIGANAAIFSAVNGILRRPLPYIDSSRLITIKRDQVAHYVTFAQLDEIQQQCTALKQIVTYDTRTYLLAGGVLPKEILAARVSGNFFSLLGTRPLLGRSILPGDMQPGNDRVAVLNYGLWMDRFGGDPGIIGRNIFLDRMPYTVVGVMPREFGVGIWSSYLVENHDGSREEMWLPQVASPKGVHGEAGPLIIARLKKNATLEQVNEQLQPLSARFALAYRAGTQGLKLRARIFDAGIDPRMKIGLLILLGAVGFVLLMACVNVTSLLVARSWTRQRELAIRKALGATRLRILRQFMAESLVLALAGGVVGVFISMWGIRLLRFLAPPNTPRVDLIRLDGRVLCFTMGISLLVAVLVGLAPALQASSQRMANKLKESRGNSYAAIVIRQPKRLRSALVVLEVLLAVIVVVGGALMMRSFHKLMSVNTGVSSNHALMMHVQLSDRFCTFRNEDWEAQERKCWMGAQDVLSGIRRIPGVNRAALALGGSFNGGMIIGHYPGSGRSGLFVDGRQDDQLQAGQWIIGKFVTRDFFDALGIRIVKGRNFEEEDMHARVSIVSESFARKYIPGDPIGKRFGINDQRSSWMEIIGVVNDVRDYSIANQGPVYYSPLSGLSTFGFDAIVQTSANPALLIPAITRGIQSVDKDAPITKIMTVDQILADSAAEPKFQTALMGSFGVLGLILALLGIYGVISYSVVQQTHEIGVRMALGAQRRDILHMILRKWMRLTITGIAIGMAGALALTRILRNMLFEIKPTDPATFFSVAVFLISAALLACYLPAQRAAKTDPIAALRHE